MWIEGASSSDTPKFVPDAFAVGCGQLDCTLTRLPKPIATVNSLQLLL
jgi:hypothetical protein